MKASAMDTFWTHAWGINSFSIRRVFHSRGIADPSDIESAVRKHNVVGKPRVGGAVSADLTHLLGLLALIYNGKLVFINKTLHPITVSL